MGEVEGQRDRERGKIYGCFVRNVDLSFKYCQGINKLINKYIYLGSIEGLLNPRSKYIAQWRVK